MNNKLAYLGAFLVGVIVAALALLFALTPSALAQFQRNLPVPVYWATSDGSGAFGLNVSNAAPIVYRGSSNYFAVGATNVVVKNAGVITNTLLFRNGILVGIE